MKITFGIRLRAEIGYNRFWLSFVAMDKAHAYNIIPKVGYNPGEAARQIFREFLATKDEFLLMLDDDCDMAPQTLTRLLSRNLPIVGALTWTKSVPPTPTIWRGASGITGSFVTWRTRVDDVVKWLERTEVGAEIRKNQDKSALVLDYNPPDALSRTDNIGFHCLLIRRDALETIGEPFCQETPQGVHEDFDFSSRAICAGFDLFVDKTVFAGHINPRSIGPMDFWAWMLAFRMDSEEAAKIEVQADKLERR
jgi:hypothetical protein